MKQFSFKSQTPGSHGGLIEKVEIVRSRLRLASYLDKQEIAALLEEFNALRADILLASRTERLERATTQTTVETTGGASKRSRYDELGFEGVLGESPGLLEALEIVRKAAPTMLPILIDGESGTGKELFAKVIHANSTRADKPFVSINCGAIPENLIESELFGHKKGAFTGATSDRKGRFEAANGGTIFLDEVGELPMQGQVKLLRVLQASEIQRVGSDEVTAVDTRVVAATNRNLAQMSEEGAFREDLFYRLGVIHASLPPLRERRDEIPLLCDYFFTEASEQLERPPVKLSENLHQFLLGYAYPGNVRELRNLVYRLSCLADEVADIVHLPKNIRTANTAPVSQPESYTGSLADVKRLASDAAEKRFLENGLRDTKGRVVDLAKRLDLNRSHLQTLLKKHGIQSKAFKQNKGSN
jgi:transcriptional regulator with GAF, ATPase, and Fis domain|tara:strand:+ start:3692 stop:4939 length:1248 start_codon:yes stop_codon:yes gene_type:complete